MKALLEQNLGDTRARKGCESVSVRQDHDDPDTIVLIERRARRADDTAYRDRRAGAGAITAMAGLVARPPSVQYLDDVDA